MFCSNCGVKANGKFCSACGAQLQTPTAVPELSIFEELPTPPTGNWVDEIVYDRILQHPQVRDRIAKAALLCEKKMTGEEMLALFDKVVTTGVSFEKLTEVLVPVFDRMGLRTGKRAETSLNAPAGRALLATLCTFARQGYAMKNVDQLDDGCLLTATIPSTMWTYRGDLMVGLTQLDGSIQIQAATKIPGQLIDWGKSKRVLDELFGEIHNDLSLQRAEALAQRGHAA